LDETIVGMLGANPTKERLRLAAYYLTDLAFEACGAKLLAWGCLWSGTPMDSPVSQTTW
jgi:hypothetical protein